LVDAPGTLFIAIIREGWITCANGFVSLLFAHSVAITIDISTLLYAFAALFTFT
jgi:hypothetical protein